MEPCLQQHEITSSGLQWLETVFQNNKIPIDAFLKDAETVLTSAHPKKKTLFLEGASNTGKTLVQELLLSDRGSVGYAELTGRERFELTPIVNANIAVVSELRATIRNVDKAKRLFGGEKMPIEQKNRGTAIVHGKPVIVTAQTGWNGWLGSSDLRAMTNRMFRYKFKRELKEAPVILCPCYWKQLRKKWLPLQNVQEKTLMTNEWMSPKEVIEVDRAEEWDPLAPTEDS